MNLAEDLWLRGKSAQQSMLHLYSFNSAVMTSVATQSVALSVTAPLTFWAAVGRAGAAAPVKAKTAEIIDFTPPAPAKPAKPAAKKAEAKAAPAKRKAAAKPAAPAKAEAAVAPAKVETVVTPAGPAKAKAPAKPATPARAKTAAKPKAKAEAKVEVPAKAKAPAKAKSKAKPAPKPAPAPEPVPEPVVAQDAPNPHLLDAPRGGKADDLTTLKGVGGKLAETLNEFGIYHYDQIAGLNDDGIAWLDEQQKGFKMLCARYDLVGQARARG